MHCVRLCWVRFACFHKALGLNVRMVGMIDSKPESFAFCNSMYFQTGLVDCCFWKTIQEAIRHMFESYIIELTTIRNRPDPMINKFRVGVIINKELNVDL